LPVVTPTALDGSALAGQLGLADTVVDADTLSRSVRRFAEQHITLPTFEQLAHPGRIAPRLVEGSDPNAPAPGNLFRVHWYNDLNGERALVPNHMVLPPALSGVESPIIVVFGDRFPMIAAHKVLAAYACLAPRIITGQFDPTRHRAIWPSTGNYARGGVAISRIMASRGVAILPAGMSQERFDWLDRWCADPAQDVIRTVGTESNVKEIYDACNELAKDPDNFVFNQFCEFGNHLAHFDISGVAFAHVFEHVQAALGRPDLRLAAFTSATGSAGTIGAGDRLKEAFGTKIVAVEALECPTMLENGFGEHNIQGIGDKHIPLIHNVMNTDVICAVSDSATDELGVMFNSEMGRRHLAVAGVPNSILAGLEHMGLSSICNVLAAIKTVKLLDFGPDDAVLTVATDGAPLYSSERAKAVAARFDGEFTEADAAATFARHVLGADTADMIECTHRDRARVFNLGYYTWVEQQGTPIEVFEVRRSQAFWRNLRGFIGIWDEMIEDFNARVASVR
jgi:cysteine synthase